MQENLEEVHCDEEIREIVVDLCCINTLRNLGSTSNRSVPMLVSLSKQLPYRQRKMP
jgi:hypothetical protein